MKGYGLKLFITLIEITVYIGTAAFIWSLWKCFISGIVPVKFYQARVFWSQFL